MTRRASFCVAALALAATLLSVAYAAGRPLDSADLWWHMAMGSHYVAEGPWPDGDPLLHTALPEAPIQHEWLFGVVVHAIESGVGFFGLRAVHALSALAILGFAFLLIRREGRNVPVALAGTVIFASLSVWRLAQFRPDLVSIPGAMAIAGLLLLHPGLPSWHRVAWVCLGTALWANFHSLFAIGPALLVAGLIGLALRESLSRIFSVDSDVPDVPDVPAAALATRWSVGLVGSLLLSALNPRGFGQHLTFFTSSSDTAVWLVRDEWTHFNPFVLLPEYGMAVSRFSWLLSDVVVAVFLGLALLAFLRFLRDPSRETLAAADPVRFGLGLAGVVALLVSIRFQWMLIFALLFIVNALRVAVAHRGRSSTQLDVAAAATATLCAGLALTGPLAPSLDTFRPARLSRYFTTPYETSGYYLPGVRFLRESGVEGNLFNAYLMGGFLDYWTSPELRTFIDGRTEHYPPQVVSDYLAVNNGAGAGAAESLTAILERRGVDIFFGVGLPIERRPDRFDPYTTTHLARNPDWTLVERGLDHAIYIRNNPRNRENLDRIARYYASRGVPFDSAGGLDLSRALKEQPDWARAQGLLPVTEQRLQKARTSQHPAARFRALQQLALFRFLVGDLETQIALDREAVAMQPGNKASWRRLTVALALLDRWDEAEGAARRLLEAGPNDMRSRAFATAARSRQRERLLLLPVLTETEAMASVAGRIAPPDAL